MPRRCRPAVEPRMPRRPPPAARPCSTSRVRAPCTRPRAPVPIVAGWRATRATTRRSCSASSRHCPAFLRSRAPIVGERAAMPVTPVLVSRTSIPDSPPPESRAVTRTLPERPHIVTTHLDVHLSRDHGVLQTPCVESFPDRADASRSACFRRSNLNARMTRSGLWRSRPVHRRLAGAGRRAPRMRRR